MMMILRKTKRKKVEERTGSSGRQEKEEYTADDYGSILTDPPRTFRGYRIGRSRIALSIDITFCLILHMDISASAISPAGR